jgi:hypothetical protein
MTFDLTKRQNEIEELNRLGREGWEAVAMVSSWGVGWRFLHPIVLLKRLHADDKPGVVIGISLRRAGVWAIPPTPRGVGKRFRFPGRPSAR